MNQLSGKQNETGLSDKDLAEYKESLAKLYGNNDSDPFSFPVDASGEAEELAENTKNENITQELVNNSDNENTEHNQPVLEQAGQKKPSKLIPLLNRIAVLLDDIPKQAYLITIVSLLVLALAISGLLTIKLVGVKNESHADLVTLESNIVNNSNFTFLSKTVNFAGEPLTLLKMTIDSVATVFYFNRMIPLQEWDVSLTDDNGRNYALDLGYPTMEESGAIRFESLHSGVKSFDVKIASVTAGETATFPVKLKNEITMPPARYLNEPKRVYTDNSGAYAEINSAVFSSSGSILQCGIGWSEHEIVQFSTSEILLSEYGKLLDRKNNRSPLHPVSGLNLKIGRLDFSPLHGLTSKIGVTFSNFYKRIVTEQKINALPLLKHRENEPITLDIGQYSLVLERMGRQGSNYVLVAHGEDKNNNNERVEMRMDVTLHCVSSGIQIDLPGTVTAGDIGSDTTFFSKNYTSLIDSASEITLEIKAVLVKLPKITVIIDLQQESSPQMAENEAEALSFLYESFRSRLNYKSGTAKFDEITGFADGLLTSEALMSNYHPLDITASPTSAIQAVAYNIGANRFDAIVSEIWIGSNDLHEIHFFRSHLVTAQRVNGNWSVTYDEIAK